MDSFVRALEAEIASLEADLLSSEPRYRKIVRLREALAEYEAGATEESKPETNGDGEADTITQLSQLLGTNSEGLKLVPMTKKDRMRAEIRRFLETMRDRRVHRDVVVDHLISKGIMGTETDPHTAISVYLAKWRDEFATDGKGTVILLDKPKS
jgi:hypothetical protein